MEELSAEDFIDDRALTAAADDRFRHTDFAVELADIVTTVKAPANIALFAPWGSGKSGLANLLKHELSQRAEWRTKKLRFAKFDAFKFAETPLRRNFIAEMARELEVDGREFREGLYHSETKNHLAFDKEQASRLTTAFGLALLVVLAATAGIVLLAAAVAGKNIGDVAAAYLLPAVPLSAVITAFIALATRGLNVTVSKSAPSTEEEFEKRFCDLLDKADADRVVIFVDELDRCAPHEVASTLETIKTFLEVERCVFIVAADHQVLEQALRKRVRQQTPHDVTNPYYSAGSSYLDKVFQFQLALPQLRPRRLTDFAIGLVQGRRGVWQRIERLDDVISVLIPSHVTSPRRVKVLLNSFAITYRLAERRVADGVLGGELTGRAAEIARLVCLRCEFPLFADELHYDVRLLDALQYLAEADREATTVAEQDGARDAVVDRLHSHGGFSRALAERAVAYFSAERPVAELLATDDNADDDDVGSSDDSRKVREAHTQQLIRYVLKTRHVPGPYRDLVHLEGSAVGLALDPADAEELERASVDDDFRAVERLIEGLEEDKRPDGLRLLAQLVGEALTGLEGDNATAILFRAAARFPDSVEPVLDKIVAAVNQHQRPDGPREESYAGALLLARMRGGDAGARLREQILMQTAALDREDVRLALIEDAERLPAGHEAYLAQATTRSLLETAAGTAVVAERISFNAFMRAVSVAESALIGAVREHYSAQKTLDDEAHELDEDRADELRATLLSVAPDASLSTLIDAFREEKRWVEAERLVGIALAVDHPNMREMVERRIGALSPLEDGTLVLPILQAVWRRAPQAWPQWLGAFPDGHTLVDAQGEAATALAERLWSLTQSDDPPTDEVRAAALASLERIGAPASATLPGALTAAHGAGLSSAADAQARSAAFDLAFEFVDAGLANRTDIADRILDSCADTLLTEQSPTTSPGARSRASETEHNAVADHVVREVLRALPYATAGEVRRIAENLSAPRAWVSAAETARLQLHVANQLTRLGDPPPKVDWVASRAANWGEHVLDEIGDWLTTASPAAADAFVVLWHVHPHALTDRLTDALRTYSARLSPRERFELAGPVYADKPNVVVNHDVLRAINFADADPDRVTDALVAAFESASNHDQRRHVLKVWQTFAPAKENVRRRLAEAIWLPLAEKDATGLRIALEYFGLVVPAPRGVRDDLIDRLQAIKITNDDLAKARDRRMLDAGWLQKSGVLRRGRRKRKDPADIE